MDILNLPDGYYFDEVHGVIEKLDPDWHVSAEAAAQATFTLYEETSRGLVDHGIDRDEMGYLFLAVAKAVYDNANRRYVDVYVAAPGSNLFDPHPIAESWFPTLKIDLADVLCCGPHLLLTATTHLTVEAPRLTKVEGKYLENVCHQKKVEREGPCGPLGLPYYRPNNNVTRGQLAKIEVLSMEADGYVFTGYDPNHQYFEDVPVGSTYHEYTAKLASIDAISGYACTP